MDTDRRCYVYDARNIRDSQYTEASTGHFSGGEPGDCGEIIRGTVTANIPGKDERNMTTVPMADTIGADAKNIPVTFPKIAWYGTGGGSIPWTAQEVDRFPHSGKVSIDQTPGLAEYAAGKLAVADVEPGAGTIQNFVNGTRLRNARSQMGHGYCSVSNLPVMISAMVAGGLDLTDSDFWVADWNLSQSQASQMVGKYTLTIAGGRVVTIDVASVQWASPTSNPHTILPGTNLTLLQANVDLSETAPGWFAYVPPKPPATETGMVVYVNGGFRSVPVVSHDSGKTWDTV